MRRSPGPLLLLLVWLAALVPLAGQSGQAPKPATPGKAAASSAPHPTRPAPAPKQAPLDLSKPTLFVVGYAHLDTQWRWDYPTTIREYLPKTVRNNFDLIEKYPHYVFNFSGANRYRMIKEYYPDDFARIKKYVAAGRWFPAGSSMEENDVNSPSAESIIRQILYGKEFFRREFGKTSAEFMLPDCFGFPASLPTILAHVGIKGFSTQKLSASWQPAPHVGGPDSPEKTPQGIPFNVGVWEGPDGESVIAALNPGSYGGSITYDLSNTAPPPTPNPARPDRPPTPNVDWPTRIDIDGRLTGAYTDYMYYGTGDTGGSPNESSVKFLEAIATRSKTPIPPLPPPPAGGRGGQTTQPAPQPVWPTEPKLVGDGPVKIVSATAEQMFLNIKPDQAAKMPRYKGDLELINHSAGSITSQTYMKRWNRQNEVLADDAERASVLADWLGGRPYPLKRLTDAWTLVMGAQFHDIIPGTSIPKAYEYSWNDEILASNQFAGVLTSATEAIASALDTSGPGTAIVVFNPLNVEREDLVEAAVPATTPQQVQVVGPDGKRAPGQRIGDKVLFVARVPSVGFAVFHVQPSDGAEPAADLKVTPTSLENSRYRVTIDNNGDVAAIFDKSLNRDLLSAPARLEIKTDSPAQWPAWNMDYADQVRAPRAYVSGPAKVRVVESGPVRVALEITRETEGSTFVQTIRLAAGDGGNRIEFANAIDWATKASHLKAVFPLTASNSNATYNWDVGTIERPTDMERQFEVASHQWVDLTDKSGAFGATVLTDCKNASDKPDDHTLRLTLVRTPGINPNGNGRNYPDQDTLDLGHHEFVYGLAGHVGDFRQAQTDWQAERLNQPLAAFTTPAHGGRLGHTFSLLRLNDGRVRVLALKKAEQGDETIVRLVEMDGRKHDDVRLTFGAPVVAAREVNGAEEPVGPAKVVNGVLVTGFSPFQPRTFAVRLSTPPAKVAPPLSQPVALPYNQAVASPDRSVSAGNFDGNGRSLPAEMLPSDVPYGAVHFRIAPTSGVEPDAVIPRGQVVALPPSSLAVDAQEWTRLYVLAAATTDADQKATFKIDGKPVDLTIESWGGYIGQWDNRVWRTREEPVPRREGQPPPPPGTPTRMRTIQEFTGIIDPGFIKRAPVAWFASHRHGPDGMAEPYAYSYLFAYTIDLPPGAKTITLPVNDRIRVMAMTVSNEGGQVLPAYPLYDTLERTAPPPAVTDR